MRELLILLLLFPLYVRGQIPAGLAMDCMHDRAVTINEKTIYLAKGEIMETLSFITWEPGLMNGFMRLTNAKGDTLSFWAYDSYVKDTITGIFYALKFGTEDLRDVKIPSYFCRKEDIAESLVKYSIEPHSRWNTIYIHSLDYDTVVEGRCNGTGRVIQEMWSTDKQLVSKDHVDLDSFEVYKKGCKMLYNRYCRCPEDPSMNGQFLDNESGETLQILTNPLQVYYRSKSKTQWQKLRARQEFPGCLSVSFTPDFSKKTYPLYFTGNTWLIPGDSWPEPHKPQYFQPVKP
jgi:hypothetical protein